MMLLFPSVRLALRLFLPIFLWCTLVSGQDVSIISTDPADVYVDGQGVMRWGGSEEEIQGFGVNYTVPFAHAYRSAVKLGVNPLEAIDQDVYHFARLGFDLYRVHVWDTEISDTLGNLLFNEHLNAFDYLLKKLGERNINYVLTPIAYWGNGYPEPEEPTPGFSAKYGKGDCLTDPEAIKAQENYLYQFMNHVNPYTGIAYKNDPRLIAVEISNEPHHREAPEQVTAFVRRMVDAVRRTGFGKPVFYNISHSVHLVNDYFKGGIQGGTFQWYPTGLGYQRELPGNFLPNVDQYLIPFDEEIRKHKGAKLVYEFDAADVGRSYLYPAMARSFRKAGIQIATHFSYDPMFLAHANTEYNTHFMNLAYAPQKALSLMICSEVFHRIPMYEDYGAYPGNTTFGEFTVSYEQDLALLNGEEKYYYTNSTPAAPKNETALQHIAGYGTSPLIAYDGTGAYFLDKLESGAWRLEVMPDALIVDNPYGRNSLKKEVAVAQWNERTMSIRIQDLGNRFTLTPLNEGNTHQPQVADGQFSISPGVYLATRAGREFRWDAQTGIGNIRLPEFYAPERPIRKTYLVHHPASQTIAGEPLTIRAQVLSPDPSIRVQLLAGGGFRDRPVDMVRKHGFTYEATLPGEQVQKGFLTYYLVVSGTDKVETFPAGEPGLPFQWDFYNRTPYTVRVIGKDQPIYLFNAQEDRNYLSVSRWGNTLQLSPSDHIGESELQLNLDELFRVDPEHPNGPVIRDYTIRHYLKNRVDHVRGRLGGKKTFVLKARSLNDKPAWLQVALITTGGRAFGKVIEIGPELKTYDIPLSELQAVDMVTMPRPYPTFLPYYFSNNQRQVFQLADIEGLQFSVGPGIPADRLEEKHGVAVVSGWLE